MQNIYLGITDTNWMKFMRTNKANIGEYINFWTPGSKIFKALEPGELFLFKLHAKKAKGENGEIVGGAYFYGFEKMSPLEAWNRFGKGNGSNTLFEMQASINEYRVRNNLEDVNEIGCIILRNPFFFEENQWIESPEDWGKSIVSGKKYTVSNGTGKDIFERVLYLLKEKNEKQEIDINIATDIFEKEKMAVANQRVVEAEKLRAKFVYDYPVNSILNMSLDEYLIAPKGSGNEKSFCRRIRYELEGLAHMGNAFPQVFGLFLKNGKSIELSPTLKKEFGENINAAFSNMKKQIVTLLNAAEENDYETISKCKLNSLFKYKLLIIYYPEKYFPVCAKETLDAYCKVVGIVYPDNVDMVYRNVALLEWKKENYPFCEWSNAMFMLFCDWVWRQNKKLNLKKLQKSSIVDIRKIEQDLDNLKGKDREAIVKIRVNQGVFRNKLLDKYGKCCLCHVQNKELLIASHIKPWSVCEANEKLDVNNGLLLCPNHDCLFDGGWISFSDSGDIMISKKMELVDKINMNVVDTMRIKIDEENKKYLKYHRDEIFKK